jgi:hypothetical protein
LCSRKPPRGFWGIKNLGRGIAFQERESFRVSYFSVRSEA